MTRWESRFNIEGSYIDGDPARLALAHRAMAVLQMKKAPRNDHGTPLPLDPETP